MAAGGPEDMPISTAHKADCRAGRSGRQAAAEEVAEIRERCGRFLVLGPFGRLGELRFAGFPPRDNVMRTPTTGQFGSTPSSNPSGAVRSDRIHAVFRRIRCPAPGLGGRLHSFSARVLRNTKCPTTILAGGKALGRKHLRRETWLF